MGFWWGYLWGMVTTIVFLIVTENAWIWIVIWVVKDGILALF